MKNLTLLLFIVSFYSCESNVEKYSDDQPHNTLSKIDTIIDNDPVTDLYNSIVQDRFPDFSFDNHIATVQQDQQDKSYIHSIISRDTDGLADGPFVGFYPNGNIQSIAFYKKDTIIGWVEWYDSTGLLEECQVPFPPPLDKQGKMIYFEKYNKQGNIGSCWSARFEPSDKELQHDSDTISLKVSMCCDECISYNLKTSISNNGDTIRNSLSFVGPDTTIAFSKIKFGLNKVMIQTYGIDHEGRQKIGLHWLTINRPKNES